MSEVRGRKETKFSLNFLSRRNSVSQTTLKSRSNRHDRVVYNTPRSILSNRTSSPLPSRLFRITQPLLSQQSPFPLFLLRFLPPNSLNHFPRFPQHLPPLLDTLDLTPPQRSKNPLTNPFPSLFSLWPSNPDPEPPELSRTT